MAESGGFRLKNRVAKEHNSHSGFQTSAEDQYKRCIHDTPGITEYKRRTDLTIDEIAELRCKPLACQIQLCMSVPHQNVANMQRDVFTGKPASFNSICEVAKRDFWDCIEKEKVSITEKLNKSVPLEDIMNS